MKDEFHIFERIDLYLKGQLSPEESGEIEVRMLEDAEFQRMVFLQDAANQAIYTNQLAALNKRMSHDLRNYGKPGWYWYGGIALFILAGAFVLVSNLGKDTSNTTLSSTTNLTFSKHDAAEQVKQSTSIKRSNETRPGSNDLVSSEPLQQPTLSAQIGKDTSQIPDNKNDLATAENVNTIEKREEKDLCRDVKITYSLFSDKTCIGERTGKIKLYKTSGGKPPYRFYLDNEQNNAGEFSFLAANKYTLIVIDQQGCKSEEQIAVHEKNCNPGYHKAFHPDLEIWKVPVAQDKAGALEIISQGGTQLFHATFEAGEELVWDGRSIHGELCPAGYYSFRIQYQDGSAFNGFVSIMQ